MPSVRGSDSSPFRRTSLRRTTQNFAFFFSLPPPCSFFFSLSQGVSSWNFGGVFEAPGPSNVYVSGRRVKPRRPQSRRGFTRQPESPNVHILGSPNSKTPPKLNEKTPRERKRKKWRREGKIKRNFGRPGGGVWSGAGWSRGVQTYNIHNNHNHNNTNTARNGGWRINPEVWHRRERGSEVSLKGGVPKGGPQRVEPPLPGCRVWVCRVWGSGLNVGLWVSGVWAFWV